MAHNTNPEPYRRYMVEKYGQDELIKIENAYLRPRYFSDKELGELVEYFKNKLLTTDS